MKEQGVVMPFIIVIPMAEGPATMVKTNRNIPRRTTFCVQKLEMEIFTFLVYQTYKTLLKQEDGGCA
jgi:hypothetical protein